MWAVEDKRKNEEIKEINNARDLTDQLKQEFEHLQNMLEVIEYGFATITCMERTSEISSLYIIKQYLKNIESNKLEKLEDILNKIYSIQISKH